MRTITLIIITVVCSLLLFCCTGANVAVYVPDLTDPVILDGLFQITSFSSPSVHTNSASPLDLPINCQELEIVIDIPDSVTFALQFNGTPVLPTGNRFMIQLNGVLTGIYTLTVTASSPSSAREQSQVSLYIGVNSTCPVHPQPSDGVSLSVFPIELTWECVEPDGVDIIYEVYFASSTALLEAQAPPFGVTAANQITLGAGYPDGDYFWRVDSTFNATRTIGEVWSFTKYTAYTLTVFFDPTVQAGSVLFDPMGEPIQTPFTGQPSQRLVEQKYKLSYPSNAQVLMTPQASPGYRFVEWQGTGTVSMTGNTIFMSNEKEVIAKFEPYEEPEERVALTILKNLQNGGTIQVNPAPDPDGKYANGTFVTLTVAPSAGYIFSGWGGEDGESIMSVYGVLLSYQVLLNKNFEIKAWFENNPANPYLKGLINPVTGGSKEGFEVWIKGIDPDGHAMVCKGITDENGEWVSESRVFVTYTDITPIKTGYLFLPEKRTQKSIDDNLHWILDFECGAQEQMTLTQRANFTKSGGTITLPAGIIKEVVSPTASFFEDIWYGINLTLSGTVDGEGNPATVFTQTVNDGTQFNVFRFETPATLTNITVMDSPFQTGAIQCGELNLINCLFALNRSVLRSGGDLFVSNCEFSNNDAIGQTTLNAPEHLTFEHCLFQNGFGGYHILNTAEHGDEVENSKVLFQDCEFKYIRQTVGENIYAPLLWIEADEIDFKNCSFTDNAAWSISSTQDIPSKTLPIVQLSGLKIDIYNGLFKENKGDVSCLVYNGGSLTMDHVTVESNVMTYYDEEKGVAFYGGSAVGIALQQNTRCTISNSVIEKNSRRLEVTSTAERKVWGWVDWCAAGLCIAETVGNITPLMTQPEVLIENTRIADNNCGLYRFVTTPSPHYETEQGDGGGLFISSTRTTIRNSTIRNNRARYGAGIFVEDLFLFCEPEPSLVIDSSQINDNTAYWSGGAMYSKRENPVYLNGTAVTGNAVTVWYAYTSEQCFLQGIMNPIYGNYVEDAACNIEYPEDIYRLTVQSTPTDGGTVRIGNGEWGTASRKVVYKDQPLTVEASPQNSMAFSGWADNEGGVYGIVSTANPYNFTLNKHYTLFGEFLPTQ
jgi:hypothetical protein